MSEPTHDVFEVYGDTARSHGWDFLVCKSQKEVDDILAQDLDSLADGEEVRVVFRKYTQAEMDEVVYE